MNRKTTYIVGIFFIILGVISIIRGMGSRTFAYGDIVIGACLIAMANRKKDPESGSAQKAEEAAEKQEAPVVEAVEAAETAEAADAEQAAEADKTAAADTEGGADEAE